MSGHARAPQGARRLFVAPLPDRPGAEVVLDEAAARHARVLRLQDGARVVLFDGAGSECDAVLATDARGLVATCGPRRVVAGREPARVVLVLGLPKGDKVDDVVRSCTELGVAAVHLALAERSVSRPDASRAEARLERLERIAREAARQSENPRVPALCAPAPLLEVARRAPPSASRVALDARDGRPLEQAVADADEAWLVVGPEGGLAPGELHALASLGYVTARLGPTVLRVETAAPVAVARALAALRA
jgi:16S rRNA (uracil1498-N3)-methyltransferase